MKITIKIFAALLISAAALAAAGYAFITLYKPFDPEAAYVFHTAEIKDVTRSVLTTGHMKPSETLPITVNTAQKAAKVHVKEGDSVKAGQTLISYDIAKERADLERKIATARLNIDNGKLNLKALALPAEGNELLQYTGEITAAEYNVSQAQNTLTGLDNKSAQAEKQIDQARKQIEQQQNITDQQKQAVDRAREESERSAELYKAQAIPWVLYDDSLKALENAELQLNAAQLQKNSAELALESALLVLEELAISREAAEKTLETSGIQLEDARKGLDNALNRASTDGVSIKYQQQEIGIKLIEHQIEQLEADMNLLVEESAAPADGVAAKVNIKEGATVNKGASLIEIDIVEGMFAEAEVTEFDAPLLKLGQEADITTSGLPGKTFKASVTKIAASAVNKEKSSGDEVVVPVQFALKTPDADLKTGYTVDVEIYTERKNNSLAVPAQAIMIENDNQYAYVYDGDKLEKTPVTTGFYGDADVEILEGIKPGDRVVMTPGSVIIRSDNWFTRARDSLYNALKGLKIQASAADAA